MEKDAKLVSDQIGSDIICNLSPVEMSVEQSEDLIFFLNHNDKEFILIPGLSAYTLICNRII